MIDPNQEIERLELELERVQKMAAAMRHALAQIVCMNLTVPNALLAAQACCELALASDAGKDYIAKADVKPLIAALTKCVQNCFDCHGKGVISRYRRPTGMTTEPCTWCEQARQALDYAKAKGWL